MSVKVSLRCEQEEDYPRIRSQVFDICPPPLEQIEEKLHELYAKVEDIHEAVEEGCSGDGNKEEEEQGKKIRKDFNSITLLWANIVLFSCSCRHLYP